MATGLLVSVRNAAEALAAMAGGADVIDVKEPSHGPLGRANDATLAAVAAAVAGQRPLSAALGELRDRPAPLVLPGYAWAKVGLAGRPGESWAKPFAALAARMETTLVPAAYADAARADGPTPQQALATAARIGGRLLLIDTYLKDGVGLRHWLPAAALAELAEAARCAGVALALAGALRPEDFAAVLSAAPALLAVRGAACVAGVREGVVDRERVRALKAELTPRS